MKGNLLKKLSAAIFAAALFATGMTVRVQAVETIRKFTIDDFHELTGNTTADGGTLTIRKMIAVPASDTTLNGNEKPVNNVEFTVKRIGEYATYTDDEGVSSVLMGISKILLQTLNMTENYNGAPSDNDYVYLTSAQYNEVNQKLQGVDVSVFSADAVKDYYNTENIKKEITGKTIDGTVEFTLSKTELGIYLVRETSVYGATADLNGDGKIGSGEYVAFKKKQYPYLVSVPASIKKPTDSYEWTFNVEANAKNDDVSVEIEKFIERNNTAATLGSTANQKKTDVTHVGDTVEFTLIAYIPMVDSAQPGDKIDSFKIVDVISKGLTLPAAFSSGNIKVLIPDPDGKMTALAMGANADYVVTDPTAVADDKSSPELENAKYDGGQTFTVEFKAAGLEKLTSLAKDTASGADKRRYVQVSYMATVNADAVVGTAGNPNKVQLKYAAAGSSEISTAWDGVHEFIFSLEGNKTFDGAFDSEKDGDKAENVKFKLYLNENCTRGIKLTVKNGVYVYAGEATDETATSILLDANSSFSVKGVPVTYENSNKSVTLYLKETATAPGYNKLTKVVPIVLTAKSENSEYTGVLGSATVNGKTAELIEVNQEGVAVDTAAGVKGDKAGASFTVNNTTGFQLPSTGGMGIWVFVIGGILVIGCGILYYRKNERKS